MKKSTFWKLGLTAALLFGLSACSADVSSSDSNYDDWDQTTSSKYSSSSTKGSSSSIKGSSSSTQTSSSDDNNQDVGSSSSTVFEAPIVSAIIFQQDEEIEEYEFELVVHGNYPTHDRVISADSMFYEFRWNDETPRDWHRIKISDYQPQVDKSAPKNPDFVTDTLNLFSKNEMCHSYASVRMIWYQGDQVEVSEWSDPVGPLYTLTQTPAGKTEFTFTEGSENPCTNSF